MTPTEDAALATTLATVAKALAVADDVTAVLIHACRLVVETIEPCEHADVMVVGPGKALSVPASTDWVGTRIVSFEQEYGEGPCVDAFESGAPVDAPDLETEARWPRFTKRCLEETPVRSSLGLPLMVASKPIGALDLYANRADAFTDEDRAAAALFAAHASVALAAARERVHLRKALENRDIIGQAKGILMARSHLTADDAFDLLRRASQRLNIKLTAVAQDIIDKSQTP